MHITDFICIGQKLNLDVNIHSFMTVWDWVHTALEKLKVGFEVSPTETARFLPPIKSGNVVTLWGLVHRKLEANYFQMSIATQTKEKRASSRKRHSLLQAADLINPGFLKFCQDLCIVDGAFLSLTALTEFCFVWEYTAHQRGIA